MTTQIIDSASNPIAVSTKRKLHAVLAAMLGLVIFFGVGFAPSEAVHNAAHDGRHSLSVPCH